MARKNADTETVPEVLPELVRNMDTISEREVMEHLAEGFEGVAAKAVVSTDVLGQASLLGKDDKKQLVKVPFVILGWRFNPGNFNDEFVSVLVLTETNQYVVFNDSSNGVYAQLKATTERIGRQYGPILCRQGLRASEYWLDEETGETFTTKPEGRKTIPATTFYLS